MESKIKFKVENLTYDLPVFTKNLCFQKIFHNYNNEKQEIGMLMSKKSKRYKYSHWIKILYSFGFNYEKHIANWQFVHCDSEEEFIKKLNNVYLLKNKIICQPVESLLKKKENTFFYDHTGDPKDCPRCRISIRKPCIQCEHSLTGRIDIRINQTVCQYCGKGQKINY